MTAIDMYVNITDNDTNTNMSWSPIQLIQHGLTAQFLPPFTFHRERNKMPVSILPSLIVSTILAVSWIELRSTERNKEKQSESKIL
jgi:hypothetical protein